MGQKVNPLSTRAWLYPSRKDANWFSNYYYSELFTKQIALQKYIESVLSLNRIDTARTHIELYPNRAKLVVAFRSRDKTFSSPNIPKIMKHATYGTNPQKLSWRPAAVSFQEHPTRPFDDMESVFNGSNTKIITTVPNSSVNIARQNVPSLTSRVQIDALQNLYKMFPNLLQEFSLKENTVPQTKNRVFSKNQLRKPTFSAFIVNTSLKYRLLRRFLLLESISKSLTVIPVQTNLVNIDRIFSTGVAKKSAAYQFSFLGAWLATLTHTSIFDQAFSSILMWHTMKILTVHKSKYSVEQLKQRDIISSFTDTMPTSSIIAPLVKGPSQPNEMTKRGTLLQYLIKTQRDFVSTYQNFYQPNSQSKQAPIRFVSRVNQKVKVNKVHQVVLEELAAHSLNPSVDLVRSNLNKLEQFEEFCTTRTNTRYQNIYTGSLFSIAWLNFRLPFASAEFLAGILVQQLENRESFRKISRQIVQAVQRSPHLLGVRMMCSGRIQGAEMARIEIRKYGQTSNQDLTSRIDYATRFATTSYGLFGIQVWLCYRSSSQTA